MNKHDEVVIYKPNYKHQYGLIRTWWVMLNNILSSRELIYQLFKRDFINQYKKSFLGIGWVILSPLIGVSSWIILNATGVLSPGDVGVPFPVFVLISSSVWGLFMSFYTAGDTSLKSGSSFIMQVKFPHEALLIKQVAQQLANFLLSFTLNLGVLLLFGVVPAWQIVFFPIAVLPLFFLGSGIGMIVSMLSVVATDISNIMTTILQVLFYLTPVIYSPEDKSELLQKIIEYNPLSYLIDVPRDLILFGEVDNLDRYLFVTFLSFVFFMFAWRLFFVSEDKVIERML